MQENITGKQAQAILDAHKEQAAKEEQRAKEEQKFWQEGWNNCTYRITPVKERYEFSPNKLSGYQVIQINSNTGAERGMIFLITKENVIVHGSGGSVVMQPYIIITEEEKAQLDNNIMPARLVYRQDYEY